jgi:ribosomal protein L40E
MAKKSLGYVELEWVCPTCNTRNPGSLRTCQGCGSPQPPDVAFQTPGQAVVATDAATTQKATAGPDIHCPYCDARNPVGAKVCKQCGGDLTGGEARVAGGVVGGLDTRAKPPVICQACGSENVATARTCKTCGAPLPTVVPASAAAPAKSTGGGCLWIALGVALLIGLGLVLLFSSGGGGGERTTVNATVREARWERSVEVLGLVPVSRTAWRDEVPADAVLGACVDEVRRTVDEPVGNAREVCGTPSMEDLGTGYAEAVQDCVYEIVEQRCDYTVNEWGVVDSLMLNGEGFAPAWPQVNAAARQRSGAQAERYQCVFAGDGTSYSYTMRDFESYQACQPGSMWTLEVDESGRVYSAAPRN